MPSTEPITVVGATNIMRATRSCPSYSRNPQRNKFVTTHSG